MSDRSDKDRTIPTTSTCLLNRQNLSLVCIKCSVEMVCLDEDETGDAIGIFGCPHCDSKVDAGIEEEPPLNHQTLEYILLDYIEEAEGEQQGSLSDDMKGRLKHFVSYLVGMDRIFIS